MKNYKRKYRMRNKIEQRKQPTPNVTVTISDVSTVLIYPFNQRQLTNIPEIFG